tara:strand:+ start:1137 stop:1424 length:288 start_codon:yes stop_codon:yes gene_type:complete
MKIFVDIDETICNTPADRNYANATPLKDRIAIINKLYEDNEIIYWTARGTVTGIDWRELTEQQFRKWKVKFHELRFGKPAYDLLVCDKTKRIEEL